MFLPKKASCIRLSPVVFMILGSFLAGCSGKEGTLFTLLTPQKTGIGFRNTIKENETANVLNYTYFYNGGGVSAGDINNDGLVDIVFTGNMVPNRLYLNKGNFEFEDITERSGIAARQGWCTGVSMVDINGDGYQDIYICRSADTDPDRRKNLLFINNGDLTFTEKASEYGIDDAGYSTQAAFFDYDRDGDLDLFVINHSLQQYADDSYENPSLRQLQNPDFASKLFRNDDGHFVNASKEAGIISNVLSFGLGLAVSDFNGDDWPDIYVSHDFNEPDYLFINNRDGSFTESLAACMDEVSFYSMGSDFADYNNDGWVDLVTLDMLPESNYLQKMHSGAENFDKFRMLVKNGFYYQSSRNMLHRNNGDGTFSEIGQMTGISNTDWSWSALFSDFDNDGLKDLFVTNGYARDFTDMDFIKYRVDQVAKERSGSGSEAAVSMLEKMPSIKVPNYLFQQLNGSFASRTREWGLDQNTVSAGAVYADLDNDGDMDLVVSNINDDAGVYRNNGSANGFVKVQLLGSPLNNLGIGAKVTVYCGGQLQLQEQSPVRGFQSSVDPVLNFGIGLHRSVDSINIRWPDGRVQRFADINAGQTIVADWRNSSEIPESAPTRTYNPFFIEDSLMLFRHVENNFNDFTVQPLMPHFLSRMGPCMITGDVNGDGRDDLFIGGARNSRSSLFLQDKNGKFVLTAQPHIDRDSLSEDVAACFLDVDGDGDLDLYVGAGGYEFAENDPALQDRLYLNDGNGRFTRKSDALPVIANSTSCVKACDVDLDGDPDLFVGSRVIPGKYPVSPDSYMLINDGHGKFIDGTETVAPGLRSLGLITDAVWADITADGVKDLLIAGEWMPLVTFVNRNGKLVRDSSLIRFESEGWWNTILAEDMDNDGDQDFVLGNTGLNTQFKASATEPFTIWYKDFDGNGSVDPILCYYVDGVSYPLASRDDLTDQLPVLRKKFLEYHTYARATLHDIFSPAQLDGAANGKAVLFSTIYLENRGADGLVMHELPAEAQYAPVYAGAVIDANGDGNKDLVLAGNNTWARVKFGYYRANRGALLLGDGRGSFRYVCQAESGLGIRNNTRSLLRIHSNGRSRLLCGINDGNMISYRLNR